MAEYFYPFFRSKVIDMSSKCVIFASNLVY